nr:uncharacterized protein LOC128686458 [Cherax quadricarinatus]
MKAPCCLLGAGALPRPPERAPRPGRPRGSYTYMLCVWWWVVVVVGSSAQCPIRTDAHDVASKAYVSPQVVEAVVREVSPSLPGRPYTVSVVVSKKLRSYTGRARVKKRASLTLTYRHPPLQGEISAASSDSAGECLVSAILKPGRKYLLFLSGGRGQDQPVPVAPPEPATKKLRRIVRKTVCKNCGAAPSVSRLQDDSVVENYNLTLECSVQGTPLPQVLWYKNDTLITSSSRNIRVRTRPRNLRRRKVKRPRSSTLRRRRNSSAVSRSSPWVVGRPVGGPRRRQIRRRLGEPEAPGRGSHSVATAAAEEVAGRRGKLLARRARRQGPASREPRRRPSPEIEPRHPGRRRRPNDSSSDSIASGTSSSNNKGNKRARRPEVKEKKVLVSQLTMRSATEGDAGVYKCVAKSVAGEASAQAMIRVVPPIDPHPFVDECPYAGYCLNGGTCMMFRIVGELVCQCAEGFKGQRCQEKEVYPTFNRNCQGPLKNIRHSQGRRCPRNQPAALWELLQQTLARKNKVFPWTKEQLLNWSPTHTGHAYWPRYMRPALQSTTHPHPRGSHSTAPTHSGPIPTASGLPQNPSLGLLPLHHTTKDPVVLDSLLANLDLSQVTRRREPLGHHSLTSIPPVTPHPTQTHATHQLTTPNSPIMRKVELDTVETSQMDVLPHSPRQNEHNKGEHTHPIHYHSRTHHRHHHRQYSTDLKDRPPHSSLDDAYLPEPNESAWDQKVTEADLDWSSKAYLNTPASPVYYTMPHQENEHQ